MLEQAFKNIDNVLHKDAGCSSEVNSGILAHDAVKLTAQPSAVILTE